jgi:hypothetical protein
MATPSSGGDPAHATAEREIVISQVADCPRDLLFEAFTQVRHLSRWWGPHGFTTTTRSFEFRVGGVWDFVMHGPDGTDYQEVAIGEDGLAGAGETCGEALDAAEASGIKDTVVLRMRSKRLQGVYIIR